MTILVTGAGGFIGHHLVSYLVEHGYQVRGVDLKRPEYAPTKAHEFYLLDLRDYANCLRAMQGVTEVYALAANMGGIGFITGHNADILRDNTLISTHTLEAARVMGVQRLFYASSACVYPHYLQQSPDVTPLREDQVYPAQPTENYGWEKLSTERLCQQYRESYGLETRIARFHSIYGPLGTYDGGREKAPAALCRKVALMKPNDAIDIWGDGEQTRTYCYVDDLVEGIHRLMRSNYAQPLNLGSDRLISINELADMIAAVAGKSITKRHELSRPQGVRGRNSDNTRCKQELQWEPTIRLEDGLQRTYAWIHGELVRAGRIEIPMAERIANGHVENWL